MWLAAVIVVLAYLCGSVASAVVISRLMGLPDPRESGSRNPGATNVLRLGGRTAAALTLAADVLKGVVPVLVAHLLELAPAALVATAVAAFLGHLYPVFFGFRGGKGVATALGVVTALAWPVGLAMSATWLAVAVTTRYSSLSSLTAGVLAPAYAMWLTGEPAFVAGLALMSLLLIWRHRANIGRLIAGTESRIGATKQS